MPMGALRALHDEAGRRRCADFLLGFRRRRLNRSPDRRRPDVQAADKTRPPNRFWGRELLVVQRPTTASLRSR
jgi:hypothetical protein